MGIGLYNLSQAEITKLAFESKGKGAAAPKSADPRMSMDGSIFGAVPNKPSGKNSLVDNNVGKSLEQLNQNPKDETALPTSSEGTKEGTPSADEGRAQADNMKAQTKELQGITKGVQDDGKNAKKIGSDAAKITKTTGKEQANLQKNVKLNMDLFKDTTNQLKEANETMESTMGLIQADQAELESLTAGGDTTVFSLSLAGDESQKSGPSGRQLDQKRINELADKLNGNVQLLGVQGKRINTLQSNSSKAYKNMNKMNSQYMSSVQNNQKAVKNQNTENSKIIKIADKAAQISQTVTMGGQTLGMLGQGMVLAGQALTSNPFTAAVGLGMIAAGTTMQQVGTVAETVGNYGTMAAEGTKAVAFAAEGNIMGALSSVTSAAMAGNSAVKSTKAMGETMTQIKESADAAKQNLAAGTAAREKVKDMASKNDLGGMGKKEARESIKSNILEQGVNGETGKQMLANAKDPTKLNDAVTKTNTQFAAAGNEANKTLGVTGENANKLSKKGKKQLKKATNSNMSKATGETMKNVATKNPQLAANAGKFNFEKLSQNAQSLASLFGNNGTNGMSGTGYADTNGGYVPDSHNILEQLNQRKATSKAYAFQRMSSRA